MYEPLPPMAQHLASRYSRFGDMAEALYWSVDEEGLRLPSRRTIARRAHVSEATISRRLRDSFPEQRLVGGLVQARRRTYPRGFAPDGWPRWVPESDSEVQDLRVWTACLALAAYSAPVAMEVQELWAAERAALAFDLGGSRDEVPDAVEAIHTFLLGLSLRRLLDPELTAEQALALLDHVLKSLGHGPPADVA